MPSPSLSISGPASPSEYFRTLPPPLATSPAFLSRSNSFTGADRPPDHATPFIDTAAEGSSADRSDGAMISLGRLPSAPSNAHPRAELDALLEDLDPHSRLPITVEPDDLVELRGASDRAAAELRRTMSNGERANDEWEFLPFGDPAVPLSTHRRRWETLESLENPRSESEVIDYMLWPAQVTGNDEEGDSEMDDESGGESDSQRELRRMMLNSEGFGPVASTSQGSLRAESYWPGLLATRPLNPPPSFTTPPPHQQHQTSSVRQPPLKEDDPSDPLSATSPTSFLQPGVLFTGQQIFVPHKRSLNQGPSRLPPTTAPRSSYRPPSTAAFNLPFTLASAAASSPNLRPMGIPLDPPPLYPSTTSPPPTAGSPSADFRAAEQRLRAQVQAERYQAETLSRQYQSTMEAANFSSRLPTVTADHWDSPAGLAVDSPTPTEQRSIARLISPRVGLNRAADPLSPSARARERTHMDVLEIRERMERIAREFVTPDLRQEMERVAREHGGRGQRRDPISISAVPEGRIPKSDERWAVRVIIQSFDEASQTLTGLMHALGVPNSSSPSVTTYFRGDVLNPLSKDGLWTKKWGAKPANDVEYWTRLGPFLGMEADDLRVKLRDPEWLRRTTQGWVLMRWKEVEFINVSPVDSKLSIAGWYFIALDRSTGALEGLYFDPVSVPHQRLCLSAATPLSPFNLGTFAFK